MSIRNFGVKSRCFIEGSKFSAAGADMYVVLIAMQHADSFFDGARGAVV